MSDESSVDDPVAVLLRAARRAEQPVEARVAAVRALADLGDATAIPALLALSREPDIPAALHRAIRVAIRRLRG